jgi:hypothetical protein
VTGLDGNQNQSATGLSAQVLIGATTSTPAFDMSTDWPVAPMSLTDAQTVAGGARVRFNRAYITNGVIVADDATEPLVLPLIVSIFDVSEKDGGTPKPPRPAALTLRISHPILSLSTTGENGTIAGVVVGADAIAAANQLSAQLGGEFCRDSLAIQHVREANDILDDGSNQAGVPCTAFSIGIGFDSKHVANPTTVGVDPALSADLCDAGAD